MLLREMMERLKKCRYTSRECQTRCDNALSQCASGAWTMRCCSVSISSFVIIIIILIHVCLSFSVLLLYWSLATQTPWHPCFNLHLIGVRCPHLVSLLTFGCATRHEYSKFVILLSWYVHMFGKLKWKMMHNVTPSVGINGRHQGLEWKLMAISGTNVEGCKCSWITRWMCNHICHMHLLCFHWHTLMECITVPFIHSLRNIWNLLSATSNFPYNLFTLYPCSHCKSYYKDI